MMHQLGDFSSLHEQHRSGNEISERKCKCPLALIALFVILQDFKEI